MSAGELMPCDGVMAATWNLVRRNTEAEAMSGAASVIVLGRPYWEIDIEVALYSRDVFDVWSAFILRRQGGAVPFTAYRTFRRSPADGAVSSDAGLDVSAVDAESSTIEFTGAGAYTANIGDMISYRTADSNGGGVGLYIGEVVAQAIAVGGDITVQVDPAPITHTVIDTLPRRIDALGEFRLSGAPRFREGHKRRSLRFSAKQVIR